MHRHNSYTTINIHWLRKVIGKIYCRLWYNMGKLSIYETEYIRGSWTREGQSTL